MESPENRRQFSSGVSSASSSTSSASSSTSVQLSSAENVRSQSSPVDYKGLRNRLYDLCLEERAADVGSDGVMHFHSDSQLSGAFVEMNALREAEQLCDVVLEVERERIPCHRVVLASLSAYFKAMFTGEMAESRKKEITINGVDAASLRSLIEYSYTASIDISEDNVQLILPAASVLQFEEVKRACSEFLKRQLDTENCLGIKMFAEVHGCQELQLAATIYSSHYFSQVRKRDEYLKLSFEDIKTFLSNSQLNISSELEVYEAAMDWLCYKDDRKQHLLDILSLVRLPLLNAEQLLVTVGANPLVLSDSQCVKMLVDAVQYQVLPKSTSKVSAFL